MSGRLAETLPSVALGSALLYVVSFVPAVMALGPGYAAISCIPVALIGATFGGRAGVLAGIIALPANTILLDSTGLYSGIGSVLTGGGAVGSVALVALGGGAGYLRLLRLRAAASARELADERNLLRQEVSARRRAEGALRASEARLRSVVTNLPVTLLAYDTEGRVVLAEGRALAELGGDLVGRAADEVESVHPGATLHVRQALSGQEFATVEQLGGRTVETHYSAVRDASGETTGAVGVSVDLAEREAAERALRESEERFRGVFENAPIGVAIVGPDLRYQRANRALCDMLGYAAAELVGRRIVDITAPEDAELGQKLATQLMEGEIPGYRVEKRFVRKDGSLVWAALTVAAIRDRDGTVRYGIGMIENIDERRRSQATLEHLALFDALTDLPNRTLLSERLEQAVHAARRAKAPLAVLVLDLDEFKRVNDRLGHHAGDEALKELAARLRGALREIDTIGRLGGDEMVALLPLTDEAGAVSVARKLIALLREPLTVDGRTVRVGGSIGIAMYPRDGEEPEHLLRHADIAMYVAKATGEGYAMYAPRALD